MTFWGWARFIDLVSVRPVLVRAFLVVKVQLMRAWAALRCFSQAPARGFARQALMHGQLVHLAGKQLQRLACATCRRVRTGGRHQQGFLLAGEFAPTPFSTGRAPLGLVSYDRS